MAVNTNPYREWEHLRETSDYRSTDTQVTSLVRQQLSQSEYLTSSNRVNPGPLRNTRAQMADAVPEVPHVVGSEDMWGWQQWAEEFDPLRPSSAQATELKEEYINQEIPGKSYRPTNKVEGAST